jgi:hypothetical protein
LFGLNCDLALGDLAKWQAFTFDLQKGGMVAAMTGT